MKVSKNKRAVLVSLAEEEDGRIKLSLDDVVQSGGPKGWAMDRHVTSKSYAAQKMENLEFEEKELADIAYYILARLHAQKKVWG
jgi:hypothetical protein